MVELPVLNHAHSRPSGCVSQQGTRGLFSLGLRQWKAHILGKHLTPAPFLLPFSTAPLSIWTCSISTVPFYWLPYWQLSRAQILF